MAKTLLYPAFANPPQGFSGPIQQFDQWMQPWSEPVRQKIVPRLAVALIVSGLFAPVPTPAAATTFVSQDSSAVIFPKSIIYQSQAWTPIVATPSTAFVSFVSPDITYKSRLIYQSLAWNPFTPAAGAIETAALSSPIFFRGRFIYQAQTAPFLPPVTAVVAPEVISPDVIFQRSFIYQSLAWAPRTPETITVDKWFEPWTEPRRLKPVTAQRAPVFAAPIQPVVPFSYYNWLSEPIRTKYLPVAQRQPFAAPIQPIIPSFGYFSALSEPTRLKKIPPTTAATTPVTPVAAAATAFVSFVSPDITYKSRLIYQSLAWNPFTPAAAVTPTYFNLTQGDSGVTFQPWVIYQTTADAVGPIANPISWDIPWSEPVRVKRGLGAANQQAFFWNPSTPTVVVTTATVTSALSSEVIYPRSIIYQTQTLYPFPIPPAVVTDIKWSYPWSEPVRTRRFATALQDVGTPDVVNPPTVLVSQWYEPWIDPVKLKPGLRTGLQQSLIWSNFTPAPPVAGEDTWHQPWTEPVRFRRFNTALQQSLAFIPLFTNASNNGATYYPWSEPVRLKIGLKTHLQSFTSLITPPQPNFIRTINWYQAFGEPVRQKKGLGAWLQQFFDTDHNKPPAAPVFLVMNATEVNSDVASFAINVYNSSPVTPPPFTVKVSITEVQSGTNPWSIEEV